MKPRCYLWRLKALTLLMRGSVEDESIGLFVWSRGTRAGEFTQWASRVVLACLTESKQTRKTLYVKRHKRERKQQDERG